MLSQSGSFWWRAWTEHETEAEWLTRRIARAPHRPLRFFLKVGLQEWLQLPPARHLHDVLEAKGYDITFVEFNGGHDAACYRGGIADGLLALTRDWV